MSHEQNERKAVAFGELLLDLVEGEPRSRQVDQVVRNLCALERAGLVWRSRRESSCHEPRCYLTREGEQRRALARLGVK